MSIAINLLPDVRIARIRAQHIRHLATGIAVAVWIVVAIIVGGLFGGIGAQTLALSNVNSKIASDTNQINGIANLSDALTTQQAIANLPGLYNGRAYFSKFMPTVTAAMPGTVKVTAVSSDATNLLMITGTATSAYAVDQYYEALKKSGVGSNNGANFTTVTITSVSKDGTTGLAAFILSAQVSPGVVHG